MIYKVLKDYLSRDAYYHKAGESVDLGNSRFAKTLLEHGFIEKTACWRPQGTIESKLTGLEIATNDYEGGNKKHFTYEEALGIERKAGGGWRLPTRSEWVLLCEEFGQNAGGRLDSSTLRKNLGLELAGVVNNGSLNGQGTYGRYWSRTAQSSTNAYYLYFGSSGNIYPANYYFRRNGYSVRLVRNIEGKDGND